MFLFPMSTFIPLPFASTQSIFKQHTPQPSLWRMAGGPWLRNAKHHSKSHVSFLFTCMLGGGSSVHGAHSSNVSTVLMTWSE